jgi:SAM-dependent methyltransferase
MQGVAIAAEECREPAMPSCPLCGAAAREVFLSHASGRCVRCPDCDLIWLDPPPDAATIASLYADPYDNATTGYFTKAARKLQRSHRRIRQIRAYLKGDPRDMRFLDVGANGGFMCEAARLAGFAVTGLEPDTNAIRWAEEHYPGIRYINTFIEQALLEPAFFDVVYCSEVIEHSPDCHGFVAALARAMRPGGLLYITTPDITHWRRPRDVTRWDGFNPPSHCIYFSPASLSGLLARHGLRVVSKRPAFKPGIKFIARRGASPSARSDSNHAKPWGVR